MANDPPSGGQGWGQKLRGVIRPPTGSRRHSLGCALVDHRECQADVDPVCGKATSLGEAATVARTRGDTRSIVGVFLFEPKVDNMHTPLAFWRCQDQHVKTHSSPSGRCLPSAKCVLGEERRDRSQTIPEDFLPTNFRHGFPPPPRNTHVSQRVRATPLRNVNVQWSTRGHPMS